MELGAHVLYHRYEPGGYVVYPAILLTVPDAEGRVQLGFYHPDRNLHLGGSDWRNAIDRAVDVPTEDKAAECAPFWTPTEIESLRAQLAATTEGTDAQLQAIADEGAVKPSAEDLDAVAEEEQVKEATAPKNNVRTIRGSKVAK